MLAYWLPGAFVAPKAAQQRVNSCMGKKKIGGPEGSHFVLPTKFEKDTYGFTHHEVILLFILYHTIN